MTAVYPYAGTSGWSGSDTSRERAERLDNSGTTSQRQAFVIRYLDALGPHGATWQELATATGLHHGSASGVLSVLHKEGLIARLSNRRNRCKVYVGLDHVHGRETEPHKANTRKCCWNCGAEQ